MEDSEKTELLLSIVLREGTASQPPTCAIATFDKTKRSLSVCEYSDTAQLPTTESILLQLQPTQLVACCHKNKAAEKQLVSVATSSCTGLIVQFSSVADEQSAIDESVIEADLSRLLSTQIPAISTEWRSSDLSKRALYMLTSRYRLLSQSSNLNRCSFAVTSVDGIFMKLDRATFNALNLFPSVVTSAVSANGSTTSLFGLLNKCKTRMGSRRLQQWIRQPLVDITKIRQRHDVVEALVGSARIRQVIQATRLSKVPDLDAIARRLAAVAADEKSTTPVTLEDLVRVYEAVVSVNCLIDDLKALNAFPAVSELIVSPLEVAVRSIEGCMRLVETTLDLQSASKGDFRIDAKFDPALGKLGARKDELLNEMEKLRSNIARNGRIDNMRIVDCLAPHLMAFRVSRKQMAAVQALGSKYKQVQINKAEFLFTTTQMGELVDDLKSLESEYAKKSQGVVKKVISVASTYHSVLSDLAEAIGTIDVLTAFAIVASMCRLSKPVVLENPRAPGDRLSELNLKRCRHLLVEIRSMEAMGADYIPNDVRMTGEHNIQVITGPNMGGKSTYIRSAGLAVLMNQIGCWIPCDEGSTLPVFDSIMCRVGASDAQIRGISTFMQEMIEAATILDSATSRSLVIIDELGRGTSTQDGFGLAWAISKYLKDKAGSFVFFATHFHELAQLPGAVNRHVAAAVNEKGLTLLYEVRDGPTDKSFGPNVAALAGYPKDVVDDAIVREKKLVCEATRVN